jgi:ABC-type transporter Mla subunit MlaD
MTDVQELKRHVRWLEDQVLSADAVEEVIAKFDERIGIMTETIAANTAAVDRNNNKLSEVVDAYNATSDKLSELVTACNRMTDKLNELVTGCNRMADTLASPAKEESKPPKQPKPSLKVVPPDEPA